MYLWVCVALTYCEEQSSLTQEFSDSFNFYTSRTEYQYCVINDVLKWMSNQKAYMDKKFTEWSKVLQVGNAAFIWQYANFQVSVEMHNTAIRDVIDIYFSGWFILNTLLSQMFPSKAESLPRKTSHTTIAAVKRLKMPFRGYVYSNNHLNN